MHIGEKIKSRRKELRISVDELASILGKDRSTIYRYEKGDIESLPLDILEPIAKALHTTPGYLMGWEESKPIIKKPFSINSIKSRRLELGLTMKDVANAVGVSEGTISRWESGEISNMKRSRISDLAKVLKLSPIDITGGEQQELLQTNSTLDNEFLQILSTLSDEDKEWLLDVIKSVIDRRK